MYPITLCPYCTIHHNGAPTCSRLQLGEFRGVDADALHVVEHEEHLLEGRGGGAGEVLVDAADDGLRSGLLREPGPVGNHHQNNQHHALF